MEFENRPKVLIVLDGTSALDRTHDSFERITDAAEAVLRVRKCDLEITIMDEFSEGTSCDPESVMKTVDDKSRKICIDDYACVIAEGVAAWFWLLCSTPMPVICVNPILKPYNVLDDVLDKFSSSSMKRLEQQRGFRSSISICFVSAENDTELQDDIFTDDAIIYSEEEITSYEFWEELTERIDPLIEE